MGFSAPFIARPIATILLSMALLLSGLVAYRFLPASAMPSIDIPTIVVFAGRPGADPETMANSVAAPLERRLGEIPGVTEITSTSSIGFTSIVIQFDIDRDIDGAARDVQAAINAAATDLPEDLPTRPYYRKFNPADAPIMTLALTSDTLSIAQIYDAADTVLAQRLSQIEGVAQVTVSGSEKPAVRVRLDPERLAATGLAGQDVYNAIRAANVQEPTGGFQGPDRAETITVNGEISQAADYAKLIVKSASGPACGMASAPAGGATNVATSAATCVAAGTSTSVLTGVPTVSATGAPAASLAVAPTVAPPIGNILRLSDVASVIDGVANMRLAGWNGRHEAVFLIITKVAGANVIETVDRVHDVLPLLMSWLPPEIKLAVVSDRTTTIRASVADVQYTMLITIALVLLVVLLFMRRLIPTIAAAVTVPLSLAGTLGGMWACGFALDNFSLMALTISVGFVVDDAIVMIENITRYTEQGMSPLRAALVGSRQIGFTVVSISISLVAVFIPLIFMGGILGRLFHEFAMTMTMAIAVSAVVSLTLTPMICGRWGHAVNRPPHGWLGRADAAVERSFDATQRFYARSLGWALANRGFMLLVMLSTVALTVRLYTTIPKGFLPLQDTGLLIGSTQASPDVSFKTMDARQRAVVDVLLADPAVASVASTIGVANGWMSMNRGWFTIALKPLAERGLSSEAVIARLREPLKHVSGMQTFLFSAQDLRGGGRQGGSQYQFAVISQDLPLLRQWSTAIEARLKEMPGLVDVASDQDRAGPQLNVVIDRDAAARLGVSTIAIDNALNNAYAQRQVSTIYTQRNQYKVVLEIDPKLQIDPSLLDHIHVGAANGTQVPLSSVARFERGTAALAVHHQGQFAAATLSFNLPPGKALGDAIATVDQATRDLRVPADVRVEFAGNAQWLQRSLATQPLLIAAALVSIYIVLGVLYESLIHPITILSTLPSAGIGALLALRLGGLDLSIMGMIGIILLMGIVKKNAIMMIDFALEAERGRGLSPLEAIHEACLARFRPIMMTTLAALFGALPLALAFGTGAELRRPLGIAIIGGLVVSQMLTLYTTPVVYLTLERFVGGRKPIAGPAAAA